MTVTINSWLAWGVGILALVGACTILYLVAGVLENVADWWRDRREPLTDEDGAGLCAGCAGFEHCNGVELGCPCPDCGPIDIGFGAAWDLDQDFRDGDQDDYTEALEPLPAARSAAELGFTGPQPRLGMPGALTFAEDDEDPGPLFARFDTARERRVPGWEAELRSAYEAMEFDPPSGLMRRIRELTVN